MSDTFLAFATTDDCLTTAVRDQAKRIALQHCLVESEIAPNLLILRREREDAIVMTGGLVVGNLFKGIGPNARVSRLHDDDADLVRATAGAHLTSEYWGKYVAFWRTDEGIFVLRDPSGMQQCYFARQGCLTIITSDVDLIRSGRLIELKVDICAAIEQLLAEEIRTHKTCIEGLLELLPGHCMSLTKSSGWDVQERWNPWSYAFSDAYEQREDDLAARLRATTVGCVANLISGFRLPLLSLSGGLDSSIIAAALRAGDRRFHCITLAASDGIGDERRFARLMARRVASPLTEAALDPHRVDLRSSSACRIPRPTSRAYGQSGEFLHQELADAIGADVILDGGGGDNAFCYLPSASIATDSFMHHGVCKTAVRTLLDVSILTERTVLSVARSALSMWLRKSDCYKWPLNRELLRGQNCSEGPKHPWLEIPRSGLPGKAMHIAMIMAFLNNLERGRHIQSAPTISPLMAQPLLELCLSIPTWYWVRGGQNRSLARRAFADDLPPEISRRTTKGGLDSFAFDVIKRNISTIKEIVLGGELASRNLIDVQTISDLLSKHSPLKETDYRTIHHFHRLMRIVDVEAWLSAWRPSTTEPYVATLT